MGIWTVFVTNGAHVAAMVGGPIAKYLGWRWCFCKALSCSIPFLLR